MATKISVPSMLFQLLRLPVAMLVFSLAASACSQSQTADSSAISASAPATKGAVDQTNATEIAIATMRRERPHACELLTAEEMSQILGQPVTAEQTDPFNNQTVCTYTVTGAEPSVWLTGVVMQIEWGTGKAAAKGIGIMAHTEAGAVMSDAALGDGSKQIGPALMIIIGEHIVTMETNGIDQPRMVAKRMLEIAGPRIRKVSA